MATQGKIHKTPDALVVRHRNRCRLCGRPRGYIRQWAVCRICFRELASSGLLPGVRKSSF